MSEVSLYGIRPSARFGTWPLFLSENDKDGSRGLAKRALRDARMRPVGYVRELLTRDCRRHQLTDGIPNC